MANTTGKKFGGREKGTPNKVNVPYRQVLDAFANNTLNEAELSRLYSSLSDSEKAVFAPKIMPYLAAKMQHIEMTGDVTLEQAQAIVDLIASKHGNPEE